MKSSFATQLNLDLRTDAQNEHVSFPEPNPSNRSGTSGDTVAALSPPGFGRLAYAVSSRQAGRINAASASEDELQGLLRERSGLLAKLFEGTISRQEQNRLQYVRWSLDRIEDARHGQELELLESAAGQYESFAQDISDLLKQLTELGQKRK